MMAQPRPQRERGGDGDDGLVERLVLGLHGVPEDARRPKPFGGHAEARAVKGQRHGRREKALPTIRCRN
jgi:hypothetical protein